MSLQAERLFIKALMKLKEQEMIIEKSLDYYFSNMKSDPDIIQSVIQECKFLSDERSRIESLLRNKTTEIDSGFENIKSMVNQLHNGLNIDTDICQQKMKDLLENIEQFNVKSDIEILEKQQREIEHILNEFKDNMLKYDNEKIFLTNRLKISKPVIKNKEISDTTNYDEINNFHSLIIKTGHNQHWKDKDHLHFLNVRKKCSTIPELVMEIQKQCPDLSIEQIVNHETWYKIYLDLREKQRKSINEWRKQKDLKKNKKMEEIKNSEINKNKDDTIDMGHKEKKNDEKFDNAKDKSKNIILSPKKINKITDKRKELIDQWKIQRQNARDADEERLKQQHESMRVWKEKEFSMRAVKIRQAVMKYKQHKNEEKLKSQSIDNMENNKIIKSSALIKSLRKKDEIFVKKKRSFIQMKYEKSMMDHCNIVKNNNWQHSNNQSTLMKPTKIWNEKCKRPLLSEHSVKPILYIKDLPKL